MGVTFSGIFSKGCESIFMNVGVTFKKWFECESIFSKGCMSKI